MRAKFIVRREGIVFGIRFNLADGELVAGGPGVYEKEMRQALYAAGVLTIQSKTAQRVRLATQIPTESWDEIVDSLRENGWALVPTKAFRRLMS